MGSINVRTLSRAGHCHDCCIRREESLQHWRCAWAYRGIRGVPMDYVFNHIWWLSSIGLCLLPIAIHGVAASVRLLWPKHWCMGTVHAWWFLWEGCCSMALQLRCCDISPQLGGEAWLGVPTPGACRLYRFCLLRWRPPLCSDDSEARWRLWEEETNTVLSVFLTSSSIMHVHNDSVLACYDYFLRSGSWLWRKCICHEYLLLGIHDEEASFYDYCWLRYNRWRSCSNSYYVLLFHHERLGTLVYNVSPSLSMGITRNDVASWISWLSICKGKVWWI